MWSPSWKKHESNPNPGCKEENKTQVDVAFKNTKFDFLIPITTQNVMVGCHDVSRAVSISGLYRRNGRQFWLFNGTFNKGGLHTLSCLIRQPDVVGTALSFTAVLLRQPDVVETALRFTAVLFYQTPILRHHAAAALIKFIPQVRW